VLFYTLRVASFFNRLISMRQVGPHVVADPLAAEEVCAAARLSVGVSADGRVAATHKAEGRALNPAHVSQMLRTARQLGVARIRQLRDVCAGQDGGAARPDAIDHPLFA
jgi:exosome complex RNA-binding protein Rrp42 (RNase PH superfamily)